MKPFKWIKNHPFESLLAAAAIGTGFGAAGMGPMAGLFAADAGAGAAGAAGAGAVAGDAFMPGALAGTEGLAAGSSALLGMAPLGSAESSLFGGMPAFSPSSAEASLFGPMNTMQDTKMALGGAQGGWKMDPKQAMLLAQMAGGGQQPQRPMGAPMDYGNPMQRQAMMTQEQITKKWLLQNDPNTYARIYGAPQPMGA
jgi:hypothetical protein